MKDVWHILKSPFYRLSSNKKMSNQLVVVRKVGEDSFKASSDNFDSIVAELNKYGTLMFFQRSRTFTWDCKVYMRTVSDGVKFEIESTGSPTIQIAAVKCLWMVQESVNQLKQSRIG